MIKKTAFVIYQILVNRENDANEEKESATLRRRKNLDCKSSKGKSADFTEKNCFGLFIYFNLNCLSISSFQIYIFLLVNNSY